MNYKKGLKNNIKKLKELQDIFYASDKYSLLLIFQAMDAAGKDGTIKHVMSGINPQGCQVYSFKQPSKEEYEHHFLWKATKSLPERGRIGIFNRSYYEEVLITRVHPEYVLNQRIPGINSLDDIDEMFWNNRYNSIREFEHTLYNSGTIVLKFFLDVSKEEQKNRFLSRINNPDKNWKFTMNDIEERQHWDSYQQAFDLTIMNTNTHYAPWFRIPADDKDQMRYDVSSIIVSTLERLELGYPLLSEEQTSMLNIARKRLENE